MRRELLLLVVEPLSLLRMLEVGSLDLLFLTYLLYRGVKSDHVEGVSDGDIIVKMLPACESGWTSVSLAL